MSSVTLLSLISVSIGAVLGAETRFWVTGKLKRFEPLPYGTLFVNVTGAFGLGLFSMYALAIGLQTDLTALIGTGFFGCYTTMSSFAVETVGLNDESWKLAIINLILMISFVFVGALIGEFIGNSIGTMFI